MEPIKILLVDDEVEFVKTLSERIQIRGFNSKFVLSGEAALASLQTDKPDVMVLDLKMPGMSGKEVLRQVKQTHPDVLVLILTGHGSEKDAEQCRKIGAIDYLQKPVDINTLIEHIRKACEKRIEPDP